MIAIKYGPLLPIVILLTLLFGQIMENSPNSPNSASSTLPILIIDHDNVLCRYTESFLSWHNSHYATNLTLEDAKQYQMASVLECTDHEAARRIDEFSASCAEYDRILSVEDPKLMTKHLRLLATKYRLIIVTARKEDEKCKMSTTNWLRQNLPNVPFADVIFSAGKKKSEILRQLLPPGKFVALIDDSLDNHIDCANIVSTHILFNSNLSYPWANSTESIVIKTNKDVQVHSTKSWTEVVEILMK
jgi:uncharacterized HAD superfamily protein